MKKVLMINAETSLQYGDKIVRFDKENVQHHETYLLNNQLSKDQQAIYVSLAFENDGIYVVFNENDLLNIPLDRVHFGFQGNIISGKIENDKREIYSYSINELYLSICNYNKSIGKALLDQEIEEIFFDENPKN